MVIMVYRIQYSIVNLYSGHNGSTESSTPLSIYTLISLRYSNSINI